MSAPRLTPKQKHAIITAYKIGEPIKLIAHRFGICVSYPSLIAKRYGLKPRRFLWKDGMTHAA